MTIIIGIIEPEKGDKDYLKNIIDNSYNDYLDNINLIIFEEGFPLLSRSYLWI